MTYLSINLIVFITDIPIDNGVVPV